jgi:uncharacterized protein YydD (DUF2326 family)|nr:MAG: hypothetical protein [Lake Baikal virophage 3]
MSVSEPETKRTVDYDRIIKELTSAKKYMEKHWQGTKMNLRKWCEDGTVNGTNEELEYIRMINHTFPLKKAENDEACQKILDDKITEMKAKKEKKDAPPAIKTKRASATVPAIVPTVVPAEYLKVRKHQVTLRTQLWERYQKMGATLATLQKAVEDAGVKDQVQAKAGDVPVFRRVLHMTTKKPTEVQEINTVEDMTEDIKNINKLYDDMNASM